MYVPVLGLSALFCSCAALFVQFTPGKGCGGPNTQIVTVKGAGQTSLALDECSLHVADTAFELEERKQVPCGDVSKHMSVFQS